MRRIVPRTRTAALVAAMLVVLSQSSCSSKSRLVMNIVSIFGSSAGNENASAISADLIGSSSSACSILAADTVKVTLGLKRPGTIGPTYSAMITGYDIDYFYYDPADGVLKGPVSSLAFSQSGISNYFDVNGAAVVVLPVVPFRVKVWSAGVTCHGISGFSGVNRVVRMIVRITVHATDEVGDDASASGSMTVFLEDFASPIDTNGSCNGMSIAAYLSGLCSIEN